MGRIAAALLAGINPAKPPATTNTAVAHKAVPKLIDGFRNMSVPGILLETTSNRPTPHTSPR